MGDINKFYYKYLLYAYPIILQSINDTNIKLEVYLTRVNLGNSTIGRQRKLNNSVICCWKNYSKNYVSCHVHYNMFWSLGYLHNGFSMNII